jgi:hypothetical protein
MLIEVFLEPPVAIVNELIFQLDLSLFFPGLCGCSIVQVLIEVLHANVCQVTLTVRGYMMGIYGLNYGR